MFTPRQGPQFGAPGAPGGEYFTSKNENFSQKINPLTGLIVYYVGSKNGSELASPWSKKSENLGT